MNVLLLGSGGREHALAMKIAQSPRLNSLFIAPGNSGTARHGQNVPLNILDFEEIEKFTVNNRIELIVAGPEEPLVKGIADFFAGKQPAVIGPSKKGAALEGSKDFAKNFMVKYNIPTARYKSFDHAQLSQGYDFLDSLAPPFVLKADGLAAGKGVIIVNELSEAKSALKEMLDGKFGAASQRVVIEEYLRGVEVSVFVLTDGKSYKILPEAKDYKRIGDGDSGLNTGGMGAVSPVPFVDEIFTAKVRDKIIEPTIKGLQAENIDYRGFIFFGLMNCAGEPYLIEYNVRMGDPETEVVMPRLDADILELFEGVAKGSLNGKQCGVSAKNAVTVVAVSGGYPENYMKGYEIKGIESVKNDIVFHAGAVEKNGKIFTAGGRVLTVTSLADNLSEAVESAYKSIQNIKFTDIYYRKDIGKDLLKETSVLK
ncbi:MAG: phosphoribosylamine--glycine ligase [Prevotellaceae bacterium]|jgi:phosphoribosylamine--glycine ligase|nr:phosphoribosylamine--glycine ligase [Prevotellaceae bacterium]